MLSMRWYLREHCPRRVNLNNLPEYPNLSILFNKGRETKKKPLYLLAEISTIIILELKLLDKAFLSFSCHYL